MALLLLIIIYIAFIGLGIPDSLFGPAWPAINKDFNIPVSYASFVTVTVTICTVISSFMSAKIINKLGTRNVVIISTFMTCLGLIGYSYSPNLIAIIICAIPLGLGAGCIDAGLNNYVALHYSNTQMNLLHCFYGIGVTLSPYVMSMALASDNNWRKGYLIAFFIQLGIALILLLSYALWNKVKEKKQEDEVLPIPLSLKEIFKRPIAVFGALVFFFYCGIEISSGTWSATFLVNYREFNPAIAAKICSLFYAGLASGRLFSGILANWIKPKILISISLIIMFSGIILLTPNVSFLPLVALFLLGFGCGPVFPNMILLTPTYYGKEYSQSLIGFQMAMSYLGSLSMSPLFGVIGEKIGFKIFPLYLFILFTLFMIMYILLNICLKKREDNEKY